MALMMALGFIHETRRLDRNDFVRIHHNNIDVRRRHLFELTEFIDEHEHTLGLPYDVLSLLH